MKKYTIYIMAILALLVSCSEEEIVKVTPTNGQEVKFSVSMDKVASRTLYGAVADDGKSIKVNWVDGDEITVFGTTCAVQQANYKVSTKGANGVAATDQNYASSLEKTGAAGVQWGTEDNSDFYAIYPTVDEDAFYVDEKGNVIITTSIRETQSNNFKLVGDTWVGTPYVDGSATETMPDALMYATTLGVNSTTGVVDLNFKPFSTVLKFTLNGWDIVEGSLIDESSALSIQSISVSSPFAPIAGPCDFHFNKEENKYSLSVDGGNSNVIYLKPKSLAVSKGQKIEFNIFTIPQYNFMNSEEAWIVSVEGILEGQKITKEFHIEPTVEQVLSPGEIHEIKIPRMGLVGNPVNITDYRATWMKYIPRNVYLSELSMPGAWYCMDSDYQGDDATLEKLYAAGVRSFNIDCRISRKKFNESGLGFPSSSISWDESKHYNDENCMLVCAGTEKPTTVSALYYNVGMTEGTSVEDAIIKLVALARSNPYELISIILTFSEKPCSEHGGLGYFEFGTTNPKYIMDKLTPVLNKKGIVEYIYKGKQDESGKYIGVTSETTLGDVLSSGKNIIVKINHSNDAFYDGSTFLQPEGIMSSYAPMALWNYEKGGKTYHYEKSYCSYISLNKDTDSDFYKTMHTSPIYNGKTQNNMTYYYCQAQKTFASANEGSPSIDDRKDAIDDVLTHAKELYDTSEHNALFQLGIGGSPSDVVKDLNTYVEGKIKSMLQTGNVSPLGFVLMNNCLSSQNLLDDILLFNTNMTLNNTGVKEDEWPIKCGGNPYTTEDDKQVEEQAPVS